MIRTIVLVFFVFLFTFDAIPQVKTAVEMRIESQEKLAIGRVSTVQLILKNTSEQPVVILEIVPDQPCEEPIPLIRTLQGDIYYDEQTDEYINNTPSQESAKFKMGTMVSVAEAFLLPGAEVTLRMKYRPFGRKEFFSVTYATGGGKIYAREKQEGNSIRYSTRSSNYKEVIVPRLLNMPKSLEHLEVDFENISGDRSKLCYATTLGKFVESPPYSMYKEWDSGEDVEFLVGEEQKRIGPGKRPANWKFLDEYPVYYGDGIYKHGEFVTISPEQAAKFLQKVEGKFEIERVDYFLQNHYYALISDE